MIKVVVIESLEVDVSIKVDMQVEVVLSRNEKSVVIGFVEVIVLISFIVVEVT